VVSDSGVRLRVEAVSAAAVSVGAAMPEVWRPWEDEVRL
jgi:hypothetical protein